MEVSKLKDEMEDIKRGCPKEEFVEKYENASSSEIYQHKRLKSTTPLIDPQPFVITSKNGCGKAAPGADLYVSMISKNLKKCKGSPAFANKSNQNGLNLERRTKQRVFLARKPDSGNYDPIDLSYKEPRNIKLNKMTKRNDLRIRRDADQEAFNRLENADYSSFKEKDKTVAFGDMVERDEVSFYRHVATQNIADKNKLTVEQYTRMKQEHKSGRREHPIFMRK